LLHKLSIRYIDRDAEVLPKVLTGIVMSNTTQNSDSTIGTPNSVFEIEILSGAYRILEFCPESRFIVGKNRTVMEIEWIRGLADVKPVEAIVFFG
jgi:hypothetical protein